MAILDNSTKNLGKLKEQIEPLVDFFKSIPGDIDHNIEENLEAFLWPIVNGIKEGSNPEDIEAINNSRRSKEVSHELGVDTLFCRMNIKLMKDLCWQKVMSMALQMQGRFSAIAEISTAYITISTDYIRPAINEMEILSVMTDSEWQIKSQEFIYKCERLMANIDSVAQETSANVERNMSRHINALQRRAMQYDGYSAYKRTVKVADPIAPWPGSSTAPVLIVSTSPSSSPSSPPKLKEVVKKTHQNVSDTREIGATDGDVPSSASSDYHSSESEHTGSDSTSNELCDRLNDVHVDQERIMSPILDPARQAIADRVMEEFWVIFTQRWPSNVRHQTGGSHEVFGVRDSAITNQPTSQWGPPQKRQKKDDEDDPDRDKGNSHQPPTQSPAPGDEATKRLRFSCPFRKRDPCTYSIYSHRACALSHWASIARVTYCTNHRFTTTY
jgi:hypothetical protein